MHHDADHLLLRRWMEGDQQAYGVLVERYQGLVITACRRQCGAADADDCAQAVLLVLARRPDAALRAPVLAAWLHQTAWYVCLQARRDAHQRQRRMCPLQEVADPEEPRPLEALEHLDACLITLPERQRAAVTLHYLLGKSADEVAEALQTSRDNAYQLLSRGLAHLRRALSRRGVAVTLTALIGFLGTEASAAQRVVISRHVVQFPSPAVSALAEGGMPPMSKKSLVITALVAGLVVLVGILGWSSTEHRHEPGSTLQRASVVPAEVLGSDAIEQEIPQVTHLAWNLAFEGSADVEAEAALASDIDGRIRTRHTWKRLTAGTQAVSFAALPPGKYRLNVKSLGFEEQVRRFEIGTDGSVEAPPDLGLGDRAPEQRTMVLYRHRYAVMRYAFNPTGSPELTGPQVVTGRMTLGSMGELPHFREDWILWQTQPTFAWDEDWQSRMHGACPRVRFHRVTSDGTSGVQVAPAGLGFDAATEAPANSEYRCEELRLVEGQVLFFHIRGNTPYGQSRGYGKIWIESITMDPPPGIPIDGPTPFPRSAN